MEIVQVKIDELKEAVYNPRVLGAREKRDLTESVKEFGLVDPIIVNGNKDRFNIIVGGHQRVDVARSLGYEEVPVFYVDLDEEKEKELNLRLNRYYGEFDFEKLNNYDRDLLTKVGFKDSELKKVDDELISSESQKPEVEFTEELLEENNYVVFYFNNKLDWQVIKSFFDVKPKKALDSRENYERVGIGRVVDGKKLLDLIRKYESNSTE